MGTCRVKKGSFKLRLYLLKDSAGEKGAAIAQGCGHQQQE